MPIQTSQETIKNLASHDQRGVAVALSDLFIEQEDSQSVKAALRKIRDIIWENEGLPATRGTYDEDAKRAGERKKRIQAVIEEVDDAEDRKKLAENYAKLGHIYEIAGHQARHNFIKSRREKLTHYFNENPTIKAGNEDIPKEQAEKLLAPGGTHNLIYTHPKLKTKNVSEIVKDLSTPESEFVFTQHPTNTNTLESMQIQREIGRALNEVLNPKKKNKEDQDELTRLKKALAAFHDNPMVSDKNFTAKDETDIVVNFLSNAYYDLKRIYDVTENPLKDKFGEKYDLEQRKALDLKLRFSSWGSAGDKDGNKNIKSENTLEAIILHKQKAAELISKDLDELKDLSPELTRWKEKLTAVNESYMALINEIEMERKKDANGNDIRLTNEQFKDFVERAKAISCDVAELEKNSSLKTALENAISNAQGEDQDKLLLLKRRVATFGLSLGKIEYRETAEEYSRAVNTLMQTDKAKELFWKEAEGFAGKSEAERTQILTDILSTDDGKRRWREVAQAFMNNAKGEDLRDYGNNDTIVYHTLKRMDLARDFGEMITHNVLAECKGTVNLLEALAMQVASTKDDGARATLNIVPLFEEADTMAKIPNVIKDGLESPAYKAHMDALKAQLGQPELTQQIMIAHSDNARRAGAIASRGIIHEGHRAAREAIEKYNAEHPERTVNIEFFEGGSHSDSYRNGVRAATQVIKDFDLGKKIKSTYQGGDLLNYFNLSTSFERFAVRGLVQQVELLQNGHDEKPSPKQGEQEAKITAALSNLQNQYDANIYNAPDNLIGRLLYELGYRNHIADGNAGTRAGARGGNDKEQKLQAIDATNIRTIGFSEALQHEGIHPTFIGAEKIRAAILKELDKKELPAEAWKDLCQESPAFKDAIDKLAYSIINSDLKAFGENFNRRMSSGDIAKDTSLLVFANNTLPDHYLEAGRLVYEAMTGQTFADSANPGSPGHTINALQPHKARQGDNILDAADRMKHLIQNMEPMKHVKSLSNKHNFVDGVRIFKEKCKAIAGRSEEEGKYIGRLFHNAIDTLTHGRTFMADDPMYSKAYMQEMRNPAQGRSAA